MAATAGDTLYQGGWIGALGASTFKNQFTKKNVPPRLTDLHFWHYMILGAVLLMAELLYFRLASRFGILDIPDELSAHKQATIRGGGVIFPFAALAWGVVSGFSFPCLVSGILLAALVSFMDDLSGLSIRIRLPIHFLSAVFILLEVGYFTLPWYAWFPILIITVGFLNAYNFMDGINGITGLYSLIAVLFLFMAANILSRDSWHTPLLILAISLFIFNFFNFRANAYCFAGDVGPIALALWLSYFLLSLFREYPSPVWLLPVAVYGVDSVMTILYRLQKRENIFHPHRHHLYQNLSNEWGWPHLQVAVLYGFVQLLVNLIALLLISANVSTWPWVILTYSLLVALYIVAKWRFIKRFS